MNRLTARTQLVKRTGRYDLVGVTTVDGVNVPDYTIDFGADMILDAAVRRLDEQIKVRVNKKTLSQMLSGGETDAVFPGLRSVVRVMCALPDGAPYDLTFVEAENEVEIAYKVANDATVTKPLYWAMRNGDSNVSTLGTVFTRKLVSAPEAGHTVTVTIKDNITGVTMVSAATMSVFTAGCVWYYGWPDAVPGRSYLVTFAHTYNGVTTYHSLVQTAPNFDKGITVYPGAQLATVTVTGWFYSEWGIGPNDTCWWSVYDANLVLLMATLELGIALSDDNVRIVHDRIEAIKRTYYSDSISTEVEAYGTRTTFPSL